MKNKILCLCIFFLAIIILYTGTSLSKGKLYVGNLEMFRNVFTLILTIIVGWRGYIKIEEFFKTDYIFYKSIGMGALKIIKIFVSMNCIELSVAISLYFIITFKSDVANSLLLSLQLIIFFITSIFILFYFKHRIVFWNIFLILIFCFFIYLGIDISRQIYMMPLNDIDALKIITVLLQYKWMQLILNELSVSNLLKLVVHLIFIFVGGLLIKSTDNLIAETSNIKKHKQINININPNISIDKNYKIIISHSLREIQMILRKKINILFFIIVYTASLSLLIFIENSKGILVVACVAITSLSISSDVIYREDICSVGLYKICGETYYRFVVKKIFTLFLSSIVVGITACFQLFIFHRNIINAVFFLCFWAFNIIYWSFYYSNIFLIMKTNFDIIDNIKICFSLIGMFIPVFNIGMIFLYLLNGKGKWSKYVGN